jgi:hypothetical protein
MRRLTSVVRVVGVVGLLVGAATASAQPPRAGASTTSEEGFTAHYVDVGPVIGLGQVGAASVSFGGRFEFAFKQVPQWANGILTIGAGVDHYSYDYSIPGFSYGFSYTPIGVTVNYHYPLMNRKLDPFAGVGLGDYIVTTPFNCFGCSYNSGVYPIFRAGIRYFLQPNLAAYADAGSGAGALHVGIMFKIKN